ncbi:CASP-like protein 1C3, partial [Mucuna pruriens]
MTKTKRVLTLFLRFLAIGATIAAVIVMVTSHDSTEVLNLTFTAKYSNDQAFKSHSMWIQPYSPLHMFAKFTLAFGSDPRCAMLLSSSVSAALAIGHVGKKGNIHAGWLPICGQVPKFCDHVSGALVAGLAAAIIYFILIFSSLYSAQNPLF